MAFQFNSIPKALCCGHLEAHRLLKVYENSVEEMGQEPQGKVMFSEDPVIREKQLQVGGEEENRRCLVPGLAVQL